nr:Protein kinase [Pandoravirus belohorizontensis]
MEEITPIARATPSDTATRVVMTWTPNGWTTHDLGADEASIRRQHHGPRKPVPCLVVDRRCKRMGDPAQQPAAPKRRRTMGPPRPAPTVPTGRHLSTQTSQPKRTKRMALATVATGSAAPATTTTTTTTQPPPRPKKAPTRATTAKKEKGAPAPRILAQVPPRRWKRVRPLGCGTFGCVHEVRHPDTGDRAALKEMGFLPNDYRGSCDGPLASAFRPGVSPQSAHMVFRELAAAAALRGHPSVVAVRDARLVVARTGPCAGGIECALLMDLMHGHLGRVIRTMAGRGASSTGSLVPSSSSSSSSSSLSLSTSSAAGASLSPSPFPAASLGSLVCLSSSPAASLIDLTGAPSARAVPHTGAACPFELRVRVARLVARDILPALAFMHDRLGLAHRDIKPNNILYTGDAASDTLRFRLSDFGLARFVRRPGPETRRAGTQRRRRRQTAAEPGDTNTPSPAAPLKPNHPPTSGSAARSDPSGGPKTGRTEPTVAPFTARFTANVVTHLYKPPEVLLHYGTRRAVEHGLAYGCAVDMWSFGVVLMEVLAGGHLTPSEPEETLVQRVRAVFRLDGPPRPHLVRDLVRAMAARASTGRYGIGSIPRTAAADTTGHDGDQPEPHADLVDLIEGLLCVDPQERMSAAAALAHPFVAATVDGNARSDPACDRDDGDDYNSDRDDNSEVSARDGSFARAMGKDIQGDRDADHVDDHASSTPSDDNPWSRDDIHGGLDAPHFLPLCAYRALAGGTARADERPRAGDSAVQGPTLAARRTAVTRACTFADRHELNVYTVASAVAMFDHYLEAGGTTAPGGSNWLRGDEGVLVAMAGALFVACSLYECRWPTHEQFAALGVVPASWYAVDQRAPSSAVRTPPFDAVLCAAVSLFDALGHLAPHPDAIVGLVDGSVALAATRGDTSPWRAVSATFSRYPPSLTLARR